MYFILKIPGVELYAEKCGGWGFERRKAAHFATSAQATERKANERILPQEYRARIIVESVGMEQQRGLFE